MLLLCCRYGPEEPQGLGTYLRRSHLILARLRQLRSIRDAAGTHRLHGFRTLAFVSCRLLREA